ncbi:exo 1,3/1,4-beta-D-glucan glucohydrolase [Shewanella rhizosphaerae]|uniref:glycoside hydrolase family 3 protein n=1 Tax=Shewanella rhizosphaerae TaxID=2864207 RepID=UPI001C658183|nr:exo 1,3/1,4-beta-D-glucan glucohydrolase [Shewanella rhizosphaerae]QYK14544.1 exo 1,3/1,4-beta-D-glucan glucohydrolase [Shewanella rhizosphaerae]
MKLRLSRTAALICGVLGLSSVATPNLLASTNNQAETAGNKASAATRNISLWPQGVYRAPVDAALEARVDALLAKMSLEQKVAQVIQPEIRDFNVEDMRRVGFGSYLNGGGSFPANNSHATAGDWVALADAMYQAAMDTQLDGIAIPPLWGTDAVHGHGNVLGATLFPHNIGLGATHNPALIKAIAAATAKEVRATGIDWVFAPTVALVDNLRWGRSYEGYARDPELIERYAQAFVAGMQGEGDAWLDGAHTLATAKHFIGDGGTENGDDRGDTKVDEQTLITRHAQGYVGALAEGVQTVMASFNSWKGEKLHGSHYLLTEVLKQRLGFDGVVVGDWLGHGFVPGCSYEQCAAAINAGVDILMAPGDSWKALYPNTIADVKSGALPQSRLDDAVKRILRVKLRAGLFDGISPSKRPLAGDASWIGHPDHRALARKAVAESLVLLKNNPVDGKPLLPIKASAKLLVIGEGADDISMQAGGWSMTWQGTEVTNADFPGATTIFAGIASALKAAGGEARLSVDGHVPDDFEPDLVLAVYGESPYAEGNGDLDNLEYQRGDKQDLAMLKRVKAAGLPLVSVFLSGRPLWTNPELNASDAFVAAWLPGSEGAGVADVLIGDTNAKPRQDFVGRLPFPWPAAPGDDGWPLANDGENGAVGQSKTPLFALWQGMSYQRIEALAKLDESIGLDDAPLSLAIFDKAIKAPWHLAVGDETGMHRVGAGLWQAGAWSVRSINREVQEDARRFSFGAPGSLSFRDDFSMDLRRFNHKSAVIGFDVALEKKPAKAELSMQCEGACGKTLNLADTLVADGQWRRYQVPIACFALDVNALGRVFSPMVLAMGAGDSLELSNVAIEEVQERGSDLAPSSILLSDCGQDAF